jgi:periplasmic divalent cation tolerance protein
VTDLACCEVVITAPSAEWLSAFAKDLVRTGLCASAQTIATVQSVYRWNGEVREATEARVALRTRLTLVPRIVALTRDTHPYDEPSIVALPLVAGSPSYLQWIYDETASASELGS